MNGDTIPRRRVLALTSSAVAAGLAGCSGGEGGSTPTEAAGEDTTEGTTGRETTMEDGGNQPALEVQDVESDDGTVTILVASIDESGWLVIHPEAESGGPNGGVVLAQRALEPGGYTDLELQLSTYVAGEQTVFAMLHYDDPADGEFTFPQNGDPPVTKDGSPIVKPFSLTVGGRGTTSIEMENTSFAPVRASVESGTIVEWVNRDNYGHDIESVAFHDTATDWEYQSPTLGQGETASYTFEEPGVYEYYCSIHGENTMCGAVLVGDVSLDQRLPCEM